jgi:tetratricopeptide (TPR) repeat protein
MRRLSLIGVVVALVVAWFFATSVLSGQTAGTPQTAAAQKAASKDNAKPQAAEQKPADKKAGPAAPGAPSKPAPYVPDTYKAIMDAAAIPDGDKRIDAVYKAIRDLATKNPPADQQAMTAAMTERNPAKQVELLEKFVKDFPKSSYVKTANNQLVAAMIADAKKKILDQCNLVIDAESPDQKAMTMNNVADKLMVGELLLTEAEAMIGKSLAAWNEKAYIEQSRKSFADMVASMAKTTPSQKPPAPPTDESLRKQFLSQKAYSQTTQGEIYLKQNRFAEAEKAFKELYAARPSPHATAMAAGYLADIATKAGRPADAVDYLMVAMDNERLSAARRKDLDEAYRKTHNGSLAGLEEMLNAKLEKAMADARPPVTPYQPPKARTDRVVLAEIFTGSGCPPCVGADIAFEGALDRYKGQELAVLMYHLHIPLPDPLANPSTDTRSKFYGIQGVPAFYVDGVSDDQGGGSAAMAAGIYKERIEPVVDKRLLAKAGAKVTLQAAMTGSAVSVKVQVGKPAVAAKRLRLQIALVEERVRYAGENGIRVHPMVVRSLAGKDAQGFAIEPGKAMAIAHTFDIAKVVAEAKAHLDDFEARRSAGGSKFAFSEKKHDIDTSRLVVVAFVQDEETKQILQAAYAKVGAGKQTN